MKINEMETIATDAARRRRFIKNIAITGIGAGFLGLASPVQAQDNKGPEQPDAESGHDYPMPKPDAHTEADFRNGVMGPAMLSLATSQIAVDKATNAKTLEFAKFELREAIGVTTVLKSLGTAVPPMDDNATATLQKIQNTPAGAAFDKAYTKAQLANHEFLRDLGTSYLANSADQTSMEETHARHLAMLTLGQFKDHVVLTKDILKMM